MDNLRKLINEALNGEQMSDVEIVRLFRNGLNQKRALDFKHKLLRIVRYIVTHEDPAYRDYYHTLVWLRPDEQIDIETYCTDCNDNYMVDFRYGYRGEESDEILLAHDIVNSENWKELIDAEVKEYSARKEECARRSAYNKFFTERRAARLAQDTKRYSAELEDYWIEILDKHDLIFYGSISEFLKKYGSLFGNTTITKQSITEHFSNEWKHVTFTKVV